MTDSHALPRLAILRRALILVAIVFAIYSPVFHGAPLWDDANHVPEHRDSLYTLHGLAQIWTVPGYVQQYYPLMFTTVWTAYHLWGGNPLGYHLLTIAFHAANVLLVACLLIELRVSAAWWAALLFAIHPVEVESVAWVSELKNTQSTFFYLLSLIFALRSFGSDDRPLDKTAYALSFVSFAAALFSKTVACTMPVTVLLLLWFRRGYFRRVDLLRLAPFAALGIALGGLTAHWEKTLIGAMGQAWTFSIPQRLWIAAHAFWFYIGKLLWPHPLIFIYPRWDVAHLAFAGIWGAVASFAFFWGLLALKERFGRGPLVAGVVFGVVLAPALGVVNNYPMRYTFVADHYQYAASIALLALIAAAARRWVPASSRWPFLAVVVFVLGSVSWNRAHAFQYSIRLWQDTLAKNPTCRMAHDNLAANYLSESDLDGARREEAEALRLPESDDLNGDLVRGDMQLRYDADPPAALASFNRAYEITKRLPPSQTANVMTLSVYLYRSRAYVQAGRLADAKAESLRALDLIHQLGIRPLYNATEEILAVMEAEVRGRLALLAELTHDWPEAVRQLEAAVRATPQDVNVRLRLAYDYATTGHVQNAVDSYRQALELSPHSWIAHDWLGRYYESQGKYEDAIFHDREAVTFNSELKETHDRLAKLLLKQGHKSEALAEFQAAIQADHHR